jgi:2-polyprenyl-3-methyl-5-hydroxy-6-metoxy-1,4-benzoquinol methylase
LAIVGAENILGIVPKGTHTWEKFVKPEEIIEILEKSEFLFKNYKFYILKSKKIF